MAVHAERLLQHIHRLVSRPASDPASDAALLARFARDRDEDAFAALLQRHGGLVLGVCRRVLHDAQQAEDACQATFLVLARKAATIRSPETLAAWLHGTAYRLARRWCRAESRRRDRERRGWPARAPLPQPDPLDELSARESLLVLDEELQRLPEVYRLPVLLCCLQGRTQAEAARQLGWTAGSVKGRLERGRARLHARLARRGLTLAAVLGAGEAVTIPASAAGPTVRAALAFGAGRSVPSGTVSAPAAALAAGVTRAMFLSKIKLGAAVLAVILLTASVGAALYSQSVPEQPDPGQGVQPTRLAAAVPRKPREDRDAIQGTWKVVEGQANGKHFPKEVSDRQHWVIAVGSITVHYEDMTSDAFTYRLDPAARPRALDLVGIAGSRQGQAASGIYRLDGDRLQVCFTWAQGAPRPDEFNIGEDRGRRFLVLRREPAGASGAQEAKKGQGGAAREKEPTPAELIRAATAPAWLAESYPVLPALSTEMRERIAGEIAGSKTIRAAYARMDATRDRSAAWRQGLKELEEAKAVWCLASCLCHPSLDIQIGALHSLRRLGDKKAVPFLVLYAEYMAVPVEGSEGATIHGILLRETAQTLSSLTGVQAPRGEAVEALRRGVRLWRRWLCDQRE